MEIVRKLPFPAIPGWHPAAQRFVDSLAFRRERFPATVALQNDPATVLERSYDWTHWEKVVAAIHETMSPLALTEAQREALSWLTQNSAVRFVVTGQQPGILSGPLYTVLKLWTAIAAARRLQQQFAAYRFIPLFWVDDNDSDWQEVSQVWSYDEEYRVHQIQMEWEPHAPQAPVESGVFGKAAKNVLRTFYHCIPHSEERKAALRVLEPLYRYRTPFLQAFLSEMQWMMGDTGILFLRASIVRRLGLMVPVLKAEVEHPGRLAAIVAAHSQWLDEWGVPLQAAPKKVNLFVLVDGERRAVDWDGTQFRVGTQRYSQAELLEWIQQKPEAFTTTVLTRPLVQDMILPTALSIVGPAELAYWAELREVFETFGVPMSAVQLRYSATILEPKVRRYLRKLPLRYEAYFQRREDLEALLLQQTSWAQYEQLWEQVRQQVAEALVPLQEAAAEIDAGLRATAGKAAQAIAKQLELLKAKMRRAYKFRLELRLTQLQKVHQYVYPEMRLQERRITPWYFIARFGQHRFRQALDALAAEIPENGHFFVEI